MNSFLETNIATLNKFAKIDGVASRTEFWYFILFTWLVDIAASFADLFLPGDFLSNISSLLLVIPTVTVAIRRMHDTNHAGWWLLLPIVNLVFMLSPTKASRWGSGI